MGLRVAKYAKYYVDNEMTIPMLLFALLIALLSGVLFHILRGGSGWRLLLYFGLSTLGFAIGQWFSAWRGWHLLMFGALDIGMGVIGSTALLVLGEWLSRIETNNKSGV